MTLKGLVLGAALVFVVIPAACSIGYYLTTQETFEATINQVNRSSSGGTEVLLAEDPFEWGVIRNEDNLFILKMNSGVLSGKLVSGAKCTLTTYGWRNTWFSWKPNLVRIEKCVKA
jgi:hypothetical protein